mmetsp:Transcript_28131/g.62044  ORF Transcript_28131/g.62044 Transcript_28131/m.62044 type:complete len:249 (-) Transcript_28131:401-1147(-)
MWYLCSRLGCPLPIIHLQPPLVLGGIRLSHTQIRPKMNQHHVRRGPGGFHHLHPAGQPPRRRAERLTELSDDVLEGAIRVGREELGDGGAEALGVLGEGGLGVVTSEVDAQAAPHVQHTDAAGHLLVHPLSKSKHTRDARHQGGNSHLARPHVDMHTVEERVLPVQRHGLLLGCLILQAEAKLGIRGGHGERCDLPRPRAGVDTQAHDTWERAPDLGHPLQLTCIVTVDMDAIGQGEFQLSDRLHGRV